MSDDKIKTNTVYSEEISALANSSIADMDDDYDHYAVKLSDLKRRQLVGCEELFENLTSEVRFCTVNIDHEVSVNIYPNFKFSELDNDIKNYTTLFRPYLVVRPVILYDQDLNEYVTKYSLSDDGSLFKLLQFIDSLLVTTYANKESKLSIALDIAKTNTPNISFEFDNIGRIFNADFIEDSKEITDQVNLVSHAIDAYAHLAMILFLEIVVKNKAESENNKPSEV